MLNTADVKMHEHNRGEEHELFLRHLLKILIRLSFVKVELQTGLYVKDFQLLYNIICGVSSIMCLEKPDTYVCLP